MDEITVDLRYCAPEVIGDELIRDPEKPSFKSDTFSFGGVMFLVRPLSFCIFILTFVRFSRGKYHGKRKSRTKFAGSDRKGAPQRVPTTSLTINGT
jgi:hypothetical protein